MIRMENITKTFGTLVANDNITFDVKRGEVHALLGENGAGKSTLMSILFGLYQQDSGTIYVNNEEAIITNPNDATKYNIGMVHQHFKLVEVFTVLENIVLGVEETKNGLLSLDNARSKVSQLIERYNLKVDLNAKVSDLTVGQQQKVEILKMLYRDSDILIFDEPTAVLTPQEIIELIEIIKLFANEGKAIILITHKLNEIKLSSDRCTVLRRGKLIGTKDVADLSTKQMAEMMVGRPLVYEYEKASYEPGKKILDVSGLTVNGRHKEILSNITFNVNEGEIVGIAGIDGNGQSELVYALAGLQPIHSGEIYLNDLKISNDKIKARYKKGLSYIPEDRQQDGLVLDFDMANNFILQSYKNKRFQKMGFLNYSEIYKNADNLIDNFDIRSEQGATTLVKSMSGGNQQKVIIARELEREHNLLIAFQPTRGLDVGAIENIHKQIIKERDENKGVLLISYELDEIFSLADRILVMYEGKIVGQFMTNDVTAEDIGLYMSGSKGDHHEK